MNNSLTTPPSFGYRLTRSAAEKLSRNWWMVLVNGLALTVAGILIFSIHWGLDSLSVFIGALLIFEGVSVAMSDGFDQTTRRTHVVSGLLSIAAGVAIIVWPSPGLIALAVFLGAWLIVMGTVTIAAAFAARRVVPYWWMWLLVGLAEVPLGVLALADPGNTLAAIVTVGGIWAVAIGVTRIVLAFEIKRLPHEVDNAHATPAGNGQSTAGEPTTVAAS